MVSVLEVSYVMLPYVTNMLKCIGQKLCLGWPFSASNFEFNNLSVLLQFKVKSSAQFDRSRIRLHIKFDQFDEKLPIHTKRSYVGKIALILTYGYHWEN